MAHVEKHTNGKYRARWRQHDGRQRSKTFDRKRDADQFLAKITVSLREGSYIAPDAGKVTVGDYADQWAAGQPWRDSSRDRIRHVVESQIRPRFGRSPLRAVRRSDVQAWVGQMSSAGLAPSTVESYFRVLAAIMKAARLDRMIYESPCDRITLPRAERSSASLVPLTVEEVERLAGAVPLRYRALILTSAGLGLRQGEACGLTVDRVEFLRRHVRIDRQLITPPKGPVRFGEPKTAASNRVIPLPESVAAVLAEHIERHGVGPDGLLFTSRTGAPLRRSTWSAAFRSAARATGINASSHDLRHHCASLLISEGCSVKAVQAFLGHLNASETLDTYGHLWPNDDERIRAAIDAGFRRNGYSVGTAAADGTG